MSPFTKKRRPMRGITSSDLPFTNQVFYVLFDVLFLSLTLIQSSMMPFRPFQNFSRMGKNLMDGSLSNISDQDISSDFLKRISSRTSGFLFHFRPSLDLLYWVEQLENYMGFQVNIRQHFVTLRFVSSTEEKFLRVFWGCNRFFGATHLYSFSHIITCGFNFYVPRNSKQSVVLTFYFQPVLFVGMEDNS